MRWTADDIPSQEGRIALITGANIGLGLETVRALAAKGATVLMACRSRSRAESARNSLLEEGFTGLDLIDLDLADLNSVAAAATTVEQRYGHLDLLLNNAGVMAPPYRKSQQGHELQFAVNHLRADAIGEDGRIDQDVIDTIGRVGAMSYATTRDRFRT